MANKTYVTNSAIEKKQKETQISANNNATADEAAIRSLVENWARAVREEDMDGVLAHHTDDIVMFDVPPPLQSKGIAAYKNMGSILFLQPRWRRFI